MRKDYSVFIDKKCIIHFKDGNIKKGYIDMVVDEGDDTPDEQYILLSNGNGYFLNQIEYIEEIKTEN
ncbi:MAG: hypothetical protein IJF87_05975 [Erysipelotrichaceae bacterium]|nr:hypothetical protein [Erysipelotrichaceae bacterium]